MSMSRAQAILALEKANARCMLMHARWLREFGASRAAEAVQQAYYFKNGLRPAEHAFALSIQQALASDRWRPQP